MLQLLFTVIVELITALWLGNLVLKLFSSNEISVSITIFVGFLSFSILTTVIAFFFPLSSSLEKYTIPLIAFICMFFFSVKKFHFLFLKNIVLWIFVVLIMLLGSFFPYIQDHFGYYIPTIQWLNDFGLVKGIANVDLVLGQQSSWHILQAFFDATIDFHHRINVTLLIAFVLYVFERKYYFLLLFVPVFGLFIQSPSPDLPIYIITLLISNEVILQKNKDLELLFFLGLSLILIKITAIWIVFLPLYYSYKEKKHSILKPKFIILIVGIFSLFLVKNIYCSSNVLFPFSGTYIETFWKPNLKIIQQSSEIALLKTYDFQYSIQEIQQFSVWKKITNWFWLSGYKKWIHIAIFLSIICLGLISWFRKKSDFVVISVVILLKSVVIVLFSGQFRFLLDGFFVSLVLLSSFLVWKDLYLKFSSISLLLLAIAAFSFPQIIQRNIPSFHLGTNLKSPTLDCFLIPNDYEKRPEKSIQIGNIKAYETSYHLLYNASVPAFTKSSLQRFDSLLIIPQAIDSQNFSKGFYMKPSNQKEQVQLKKLIQAQK